MDFKKIVVSALLLAGCVCPNLAQAEADITWLRVNFPPVVISDGPLAGKGFNDLQREYLAAQMTGYQHHTREIGYTDQMRAFIDKEHVCSSSLLKTPDREPFIEFSDPIVASVPPGLGVLTSFVKGLAPFMDDQGRVDLEKLVLETDLRFAFAVGRRYGEAIDPILTSYKDYLPTRFWRTTGKAGQATPFELMFTRRVDATFGYPFEISYFIRETHNPTLLSFIPVQGKAEPVEARVGCSKTPWGKAVVAQVNALLATAAVKKKMREFYGEWLPAEIRDSYLKQSE